MSHNKPKHIMSIEEAIAVAEHLFAHGAAANVVANGLLVDGFSLKQTETIIRWALRKVRK
jgi:hypothetical protein